MTAKAALRAQMRAAIAAIPREEAASQARAVTGRLAGWPVYRRARCVLLYAALPDEPDSAALFVRLLADGKRVALPRCEARGEMQAVWVEDWRALRLGRFGLREPASELPAADPMEIDLALIPGLAFDRTGVRLGRGMGYYDRFLARTTAVPVGVAYWEQLLPELPAAAHDMRMAHLATSRGILPAQREGGFMQ